IRLGMVNANGPQDLFVYAITRKGRVEATNYRTLRLPSDVDVPLFVKSRFPDFYRSLFDTQVRRERMQAVFTEYAWDMGWCDPCASEPLTREELKGLGVFWVEDEEPGAAGVFLTRLHVRYDAAHFPEDLSFQETSDRQSFQARYVLHHPYPGALSCDGSRYRDELAKRHEEEARNLTTLTLWRAEDVRRAMGPAAAPLESRRWFERIWK
ncbi:MAG: DUF2330 domain-containing protein, partial [Acidobacteriota bacterium]